MAKQSKPPAGHVQVRLLVAHTGIGRPGDLATMPAAIAAAHQELGLLEVLDAPKPKPKPKPAPPEDVAGS